MMDLASDFHLTVEESRLFSAWNAEVDCQSKTKPRVAEMLTLVDHIRHDRGVSARAALAAYGQAIVPEVARDAVVLEALGRLLERLQSAARQWPKELKMVIGG